MQPSFSLDFRDLWTPLCTSADLPPTSTKPLARRVAGVDVTAFRDGGGAARVLVDRCPHRGVKLSLGEVKDGCLACPFHGWQFDGDGACAHVPLGGLSPEKKKNLAATALPVCEDGGIIFVFTGSDPKDRPTLGEQLRRTDVTRHVVDVVWNVHWTRAMENMLDWPHVPFVHTRTIGFGLKKKIARDTVLHVDVEDTDTGFHSQTRVEHGPSALASGAVAFLDWIRPNGMVLNIPIGSKNGIWRQHLWCIPVDDEHVRMLNVTTRDFGRFNPVWRLIDKGSTKILNEDRAVVESSWPRAVPPAADEKSVPNDKATLAFRRWYRARIDGAPLPASTPSSSSSLRVLAS